MKQLSPSLLVPLVSLFCILGGVLQAQSEERVVIERITTTVRETETRTVKQPGEPLVAAIFISNRAGRELDPFVMTFEDFLTNRITDQGFIVLSREVITDAAATYDPRTREDEVVRTTTITETTETGSAAMGATATRADQRSAAVGSAYATQGGYASQTNQQAAVAGGYEAGTATGYGSGYAAGAQSGYTAANNTQTGYAAQGGSAFANQAAASQQSAQTGSVVTGTAQTRSTRTTEIRTPQNLPGSELDLLLSNNTSALRLAQNMGADYLVVASIASFGQSKKNFRGYGVETVNLANTLRASYRIIEAAGGGSLVGDTVKVSKMTRYDEFGGLESDDIIPELLEEAAFKIGDSLREKVAQDRIRKPAAQASMATITINTEAADLTLPNVAIDDEGRTTVTEEKYGVQVLNVAVEIDGMAIGSAPGVLQVRPGLAKIRLSRPGYEDWARTINLFDGQVLNIAMRMTPDGYARWRDATAFLEGLENGKMLTAAEVKLLEGKAKMFSESGYKVDIKVDTNEALQIEHKEQSLFR